jgi:hypothetical protein
MDAKRTFLGIVALGISADGNQGVLCDFPERYAQ